MSVVEIQNRGQARHVILNRPEKRNALNSETALSLAAHLRAAAAAAGVECVVLRGMGPVFSAGIDLHELENLWSSQGDLGTRAPIREQLLDCANLCEEMTKPTICQLHGACIGVALEIAMACDFRVVTSDCQFALPEVKLGIIPDVGGVSRLPALVGLTAAKDLVMTGRSFGADEARQLGLVSRLTEPAELELTTERLVDELSAGSWHAAGRAKRILDAAAHPALMQTLELEIVTQEYCIAVQRERSHGLLPEPESTYPSQRKS
jgi:enoyl-CoA hydratase/carnithine racemase